MRKRGRKVLDLPYCSSVQMVQKEGVVSSTRASLEDWVSQFVAEETAPDVVEAWTDRIAGAVLGETPELSDDAVLTQLARASVRAHWMAYLTELAEPPRQPRLPKPAVELATLMAQRHLHLATLFKVYRLAQQATWEYITEVVSGLPTEWVDQTQVLVYFWSRASAWIDAAISASVDVYQGERDRAARSAAAQRIDVVREVLNGSAMDAKEFSATMGGYPVSGFNTAFVLTTDDAHAVSELDVVALKMAADLGSRNPLVIPPGGSELWCWVGTRGKPDVSLLGQRDDLLRSKGISVCAGTPSEGVSGFALSHKEARAAQMVATRSTLPRPVTLYTDVEILVLMSGAEDGARRFAERTLGALAQPTETAARLRETLQALITTGSVEAAAKTLTVHKNTVRYRIGQVEELLGYRINQAPPELGVALRYFETFLAPPAPR